MGRVHSTIHSFCNEIYENFSMKQVKDWWIKEEFSSIYSVTNFHYWACTWKREEKNSLSYEEIWIHSIEHFTHFHQHFTHFVMKFMKIHHEGTKRSLQKLEISSTNSAANFHTKTLSLTWKWKRGENLTQSMLQQDMGPIH
jgi:hypothetical protein